MLRMFDKLVELAFEPCFRIGIEMADHASEHDAVERCAGFVAGMEFVQKGRDSGETPRWTVAVYTAHRRPARRRRQAADQRLGPIELLKYGGRLRRSQPPGGCSARPAFARGRWAGNGWVTAGLDDQRPGRDEARQLGIAELGQVAEHVAVDRLLPQVLARLEVTAHARDGNARIEGGGIQRQQTAFAVADHSEIALDLVHEVERAHAVDSGQDLLHLKPDDVPAHFERGTVDEL